MSVIGFVLLMASIIYGGDIAASPTWGPLFTFDGKQLTWLLIGYGFVASVLPVWLLLAPRATYLSTFLKIGTIVGLAIGIAVVAPICRCRPSPVHRRHGPVWGQPVPLPVHHHRLRRGVRLPRADLVGHHAQDAGEREERPLHRLRRHAGRSPSWRSWRWSPPR